MFSRHVIKQLSSYLDQELSEKVKGEVEAHLKECPSCAHELARLKTLSETLKSWQASEPSSLFDDAVRKRIVLSEIERGQVKMDKKTLRILVPSGVLAGILVLLFVNTFAYKAVMDGRMRRVANFVGEGKEATSQYEPYYMSSDYENAPQSAVAGARNYVVDESMSAMYAGADSDKGKKLYALAKAQPRSGNQVYGVMRESVDQIGDQFSPGYATRGTTVPAEENSLQAIEAGSSSVIVIQPTLPATGEGEKIIRTAEVQLEVLDGKDAYKKLVAICQEAGGYLAASKLNKDNEDRASGYITMRIPKAKFTEVLDKLRDFGQVKNIDTNSQDVGQEYKNLKTRLDAEMVVYEKILEALKKRQNTIPEAIRVESQLTPVLYRIEALKNQLEALDNAVSFTTITVIFGEPQVSAKILEQSGRLIRESLITTSYNIVKFFARVLPRAVGITVFLMIVIGIVSLIKTWIAKNIKKG